MKKFIALLPLVAFLLSCGSQEGPDNGPILAVEGGQIQGVRAENPDVFVYRGIPYAAAPIGDLRWKEPQPVVAWDSVRICDKFGHPAIRLCTILASMPQSGATATRLPTARTAST